MGRLLKHPTYKIRPQVVLLLLNPASGLLRTKNICSTPQTLIYTDIGVLALFRFLAKFQGEKNVFTV